MVTEFVSQAIVAADHPCLAGHFPGRPIVPAVLLLDLVEQALVSRLGALRIGAISNAKFLVPVLPDEPIEIHLAADSGSGRARFRCRVGERLAAQGELAFAQDRAPPP